MLSPVFNLFLFELLFLLSGNVNCLLKLLFVCFLFVIFNPEYSLKPDDLQECLFLSKHWLLVWPSSLPGKQSHGVLLDLAPADADLCLDVFLLVCVKPLYLFNVINSQLHLLYFVLFAILLDVPLLLIDCSFCKVTNIFNYTLVLIAFL